MAIRPEQIWRIAITPRDDDPPFITEAREILREMPDGTARRKGANLLFTYRMRQIDAAEEAAKARDQFIAPPVKAGRVKAEALALCSYCGTDVAAGGGASDHVVAKSLGGDDGDHNRVVACTRCNSRKGNKPFLLWLMEIGGRHAS